MAEGWLVAFYLEPIHCFQVQAVQTAQYPWPGIVVAASVDKQELFDPHPSEIFARHRRSPADFRLIDFDARFSDGKYVQLI
jgi:hypothetical protein